MKLRPLSLSLVVALALGSGALHAVGFGELQGEAVIGQRFNLSLPLLGSEGPLPDAACFRLVAPTNADDLPWVRKATLTVRGGSKPVLELRSADVVREPVLRLIVDLACGHELRREYLLLASPPQNAVALPQNGQGVQESKKSPEGHSRVQAEKPETGISQGSPNVVVRGEAKLNPGDSRRPVNSLAASSSESAVKKPRPKRSALPSGESLPDRLMLSAGDGNLEPVLRLSTVLGANLLVDDLADARREVLRLEFRVLMSLHEQATTQLEAAEKIRQMEGGLQALQQALVAHSSIETTASSVAPAQPVVAAGVVVAPQPSPSPVSAPPERRVESDFWLDWGLYLLVIGVLLGLGAWLFWRYYQESRGRQALDDYFAVPPVLQELPLPESKDALVVPQVEAGESSAASLDLDLGAAPGERLPLDATLDLDLGFANGELPHAAAAPSENEMTSSQQGSKSLPGFAEPNPVMELADIMLSFGRVKGAAQALQEYIDNNPQEALQPWIRLMDVYRLAGMRDEFEAVAQNLNQHFNVEVQSWDASRPDEVLDFVLDAGTASLVEPPRQSSEGNLLESGLEEMTRIMECVVRLWPDDEYVLEYLNQLLRDNRGGQRQGFSLVVVDDILFLIELKETIASLAKEAAAAT